MLNKLKIYLDYEITNTSKDQRLGIFLQMAQEAAKTYLNSDNIPSGKEMAVIKLAAYLWNSQKHDGITTQVQGARSESYTDGIPDDIKQLLGSPFARVGG